MKRIHILFGLLAMATGLNAQSRLLDLNLDVTLMNNGSAFVHEERTYDVDPDEGVTESYIIFENLGEKTVDIVDLYEVVEGDTVYYTWEGEWDVHRTQAQKQFRYGVYTESNTHHELCWGVHNGQHTYHATYTIENLVQSFEESDGFGHVFITTNIRPVPREVKVTFRKEDAPLDSLTRIWAFGYEGTILHTDEGTVEAKPDEFSTKARVAVMMEFPKGMFQPEYKAEGTFEDFKEDAFVDSSYNDDELSDEQVFTFLGSIVGGFAVLGGFLYKLRRKYFKWRMFGGNKLDWYREIPMGGDLVKSSATYESVKDIGKDNFPDTPTLLQCYTLRMLQEGKLEMTQRQEKDKWVPRLKVVPTAYPEGTVLHGTDEKNQYHLWCFYKEAAGQDLVVDTKDISDLGKKRPKYVENQFNLISTKKLVSMDNWKHQEMMELMGLKKYLEDFTLVQEHGMVEVKLWNEYLVYATLFGIADQVMKDFKKSCPEYFKMSNFGKQLEQVTTAAGTGSLASMLNDYSSRTYHSYYNAKAANRPVSTSSGGGYSRSGGGGRSSWGGGGSFSGGGHGGGGLR